MQQDGSEAQEGFQQQKLTVIEIEKLHPEPHNKPIDYRPRVLANYIKIKTLPQQMDQKFQDIPQQRLQSSKSLQNYVLKLIEIQCRGIAQSPYYIYETNSQQFELIYCKDTGRPFKMNVENFAGRQIKISSIISYNQNNYVNLKKMDIDNISKVSKDKISDLKFNSKFQSGNLLCAYLAIKQNNNFHCFMENDTNTYGYNQWFYFSVQGLKKDIKYTFKILNFKKKHSFFATNKKIIIFSLKKYKSTGEGWMQGGDNITYKQSPICDSINGQSVNLYCLQFQFIPNEDNDFLTFSSSIPYSYSRLIRNLQQYQKIAIQNEVKWQMSTIAYTLSSNLVPYLKITNKTRQVPNYFQKSKKQLKALQYLDKRKTKKPVIIILARQHPGETNSSFLMEQLLQLLARCQTPQTQWLLQNYQFRIFPMVNVDGVIYGNFRCDVAGFDLNRVWKQPDRWLHPQIWAIKEQIIKVSKSHEIVCCIDLHSHSKKTNIFSYCCKKRQVQSRLFSYIFSKKCNWFSFIDCTFGLSESKKNTARAFLFQITKNDCVFTIQCSSYAIISQLRTIPLTPLYFKSISNSLIKTLRVFLDNKFKKPFLDQISQNIQNMISNFENYQDVSGSDSEPEIDEINLQQRLLKIFPFSIRKMSKQVIKNQIIKKQVSQFLLSKQINKEIGEIFPRNKQIIYNKDKGQVFDIFQKSQVKQKQPNLLSAKKLQRNVILSSDRQSIKKSKNKNQQIPFSRSMKNIQISHQPAELNNLESTNKKFDPIIFITNKIQQTYLTKQLIPSSLLKSNIKSTVTRQNHHYQKFLLNRSLKLRDISRSSKYQMPSLDNKILLSNFQINRNKGIIQFTPDKKLKNKIKRNSELSISSLLIKNKQQPLIAISKTDKKLQKSVINSSILQNIYEYKQKLKINKRLKDQYNLLMIRGKSRDNMLRYSTSDPKIQL